VDFDHSLNTAINKIREVLGDSAENPRFIETLARRGYRFIAAVEEAHRDGQRQRAVPEVEIAAQPSPQPRVGEKPQTRRAVGMSCLVALSALVLAGGGAWYYWPRPGSRPATLLPMKVVRLTSFPGKETKPAISPDGKMVAFVWDGEKGDNWNIYVMLVEAGNPIRLTTDAGVDFSPAWSPDGRFIAFTRDSNEKTGVYLIPSLGGPERRLAFPTAPHIGFLDWSPDGKNLVVSASSPPAGGGR
jgi:hypothetical protein